MVLLILRDTQPETREHVRSQLTRLGIHADVWERFPEVVVVPDGPVPRDVLESLAGVRRVVPLDVPYPRIARVLKETPHVFSVGGVDIGRQFTLIAGPCAAESRDMVLETAHFLSEHGVRLLRGGAYKPRTSPYAFQGEADRALDWLREAADRYGMAVVSEALVPEHLDRMRDRVDMIQIGARNMHNPPLLRAAGKTGKPILLKRAFSATYEEWLQAAEYIALEGNTRILLCERGIRTFERALRFTLDISAVPFLKRETYLPVCVDPSHASGRKEMVPALARAAVAAGADAVMVEVHPRPEEARSDGPQALDFPRFERMVDELNALLDARHPPLHLP